MRGLKSIFLLSLLLLNVKAAEAEADVTAEVDADAEVESLSESFLQADALAEANLVAQQEAELELEEKIEEKEKEKFIEIVSENDRELLAQSQTEDEAPKASTFVPNVFETYDATTGQKITQEPDQFVKTPTESYQGPGEEEKRSDVPPPKLEEPKVEATTQKEKSEQKQEPVAVEAPAPVVEAVPAPAPVEEVKPVVVQEPKPQVAEEPKPQIIVIEEPKAALKELPKPQEPAITEVKPAPAQPQLQVTVVTPTETKTLTPEETKKTFESPISNIESLKAEKFLEEFSQQSVKEFKQENLTINSSNTSLNQSKKTEANTTQLAHDSLKAPEQAKNKSVPTNGTVSNSTVPSNKSSEANSTINQNSTQNASSSSNDTHKKDVFEAFTGHVPHLKVAQKPVEKRVDLLVETPKRLRKEAMSLIESEIDIKALINGNQTKANNTKNGTLSSNSTSASNTTLTAKNASKVNETSELPKNISDPAEKKKVVHEVFQHAVDSRKHLSQQNATNSSTSSANTSTPSNNTHSQSSDIEHKKVIKEVFTHGVNSRLIQNATSNATSSNATSGNATATGNATSNATHSVSSDIQHKKVIKEVFTDGVNSRPKAALVQGVPTSNHQQDIREAFTGHLTKSVKEEPKPAEKPPVELTDEQIAHKKDIHEAFTGHLPKKTETPVKVDVGAIPLPRDPVKVAQENQENKEAAEREKQAAKVKITPPAIAPKVEAPKKEAKKESVDSDKGKPPAGNINLQILEKETMDSSQMSQNHLVQKSATSISAEFDKIMKEQQKSIANKVKNATKSMNKTMTNSSNATNLQTLSQKDEEKAEENGNGTYNYTGNYNYNKAWHKKDVNEAYTGHVRPTWAKVDANQQKRKARYYENLYKQYRSNYYNNSGNGNKTEGEAKPAEGEKKKEEAAGSKAQTQSQVQITTSKMIKPKEAPQAAPATAAPVQSLAVAEHKQRPHGFLDSIKSFLHNWFGLKI